MRERRGRPVQQQPIAIVSNCDVCGGLRFNAQRYMHTNDAYFVPATFRILYDLSIETCTKCSIFIECIHTILPWIWNSWIGYSSIALFRIVATPFPLPM